MNPFKVITKHCCPYGCVLLTAMLYVVAPAMATEQDALRSDDARTRAIAVRALGETGDATVVAPLTAALGDANVFVRATAMQALYALGADALCDAVTETLVTALDHENPRVRGGAAETLGMLQAESAGDALAPLLRDSDATVQQAAACALARLGMAQAVGGLIALVSDDDAAPFARMGAAWALGEIGTRDAVAPLLAVILDARRGQWNYTSVTVYAAEALGKIGDPDSVPGLVEALAIEDRHLRAQLAITLASMTGQNHGEDQSKWEAFLQEAS